MSLKILEKNNRLKENIKGITLISLVITVVILLILAGVSINLLFKENGLITIAQKAKKEYEDAMKKEQSMMAGYFEKNYVTYNGNLSVTGKNLVNQFGEEIQLKGVGTTYWYLSNGDFSSFGGVSGKNYKDYYNKESIASLKKWGANCIRIVITREIYLQDENNINKVYDIIDDCIANDMYVVVNWHCFNDPNTNINDNIEFFEKIMNKYNGIPNLIYEIYNEPCGSEVTWDVIKNYANQIIPILRKIDENAVIIVPTPNYDINITDIISSTLNYENILYSYHIYVGSIDIQTELEKMRQCLINDIPIFITEWGTTKNSGTDGFFEEKSNLLVKFCECNNISWCNWNFSDLHFNKVYDSSIVKDKQWNNNLNDEILTQSGLYIKQILSGINESYNQLKNSNMMIYAQNNGYAFWNEIYIDKITNIAFKDKIDIPNNAIDIWDVSYIYNSKNVFAYIIDDATNNGTYSLFIVANGKIEAPYNCWNLFAKFSNLKTIDFSEFETTTARNFAYMFNGDSNLATLDLSMFNTENITDMRNMFSGCKNLKTVNFTNWNTSNVTRLDSMFSRCLNLTDLEFKNFDTSKVSNMSNMFRFSTINGNLDLSMFNTEKVTNISNIFGNIIITGDLNISSWNIKNIDNYDDIFTYGNIYSRKIYVLDYNNAEIISNILEDINYKIYYKNGNLYELY